MEIMAMLAAAKGATELVKTVDPLLERIRSNVLAKNDAARQELKKRFAEIEARGEARGEAKGRRALLLRFLQRHFGEPVPEDVRQAVQAQDDHNILEAWFDRALTAEDRELIFGKTRPDLPDEAYPVPQAEPAGWMDG